MTYLFDTDHFSISQRQSGNDYRNLSRRVAAYLTRDFSVSIVTFHEQVIGAHSLIERSADPSKEVRGYEFLMKAFVDFGRFTVLPFDESAQEVLDSFGGALRVNKRDLRIAATAIANDLTLLTRNRSDFERVPGLRFEDWTAG